MSSSEAKSVMVASSVPARLRGLLGRRDFRGTLVLAPCNDVHTHGMNAPIDIAFLNANGKVMASYRQVEPGCRLRCACAHATVERYACEAAWYEPGERFDLKGAALCAWEGEHDEGMSGLQGGRVRRRDGLLRVLARFRPRRRGSGIVADERRAP